MKKNIPINEDQDYKTPLTIFEAIKVNITPKGEKITLQDNPVHESDLIKKDSNDGQRDFLFPISLLF